MSAHINYKFYDKQIVYIGDAAHSVHPIAGQGWNLGLRDVKKLYYLIEKHTSLGLEIESRQLCEEYHQACFYDAFRLFQITDKLNSLFMVENRILNGFRDIGFNIIENNSNLKKQISNFAMGI